MANWASSVEVGSCLCLVYAWNICQSFPTFGTQDLLQYTRVEDGDLTHYRHTHSEKCQTPQLKSHTPTWQRTVPRETYRQSLMAYPSPAAPRTPSSPFKRSLLPQMIPFGFWTRDVPALMSQSRSRCHMHNQKDRNSSR